MNIRLDISYNGSNYAGWQFQPNAVTIEEKIRNALDELGISYTNFVGSGRTDSGVHAVNQVANFKTNTTIPAEKIALALNTKLPDDIVIKESREVEEGFHARGSAHFKEYAYYVNLNRINDPFKKDFSWHYPRTINQELLKEGFETFVGTHDFNAFKASHSGTKTSIRRITSIALRELEKNFFRLEFVGNGFLYNMVRILTGTLFEVASGRLAPNTFTKVFKEPVRESAGITAPAKGLFLQNVFYSVEELDKYNRDLLEKNDEYKYITFDRDLNIL